MDGDNVGGEAPLYADDPANYCDAVGTDCRGYIFYTPNVGAVDAPYIGKGQLKSSIWYFIGSRGACAYVKRKFNNPCICVLIT
jgi:hypothetical protein